MKRLYSDITNHLFLNQVPSSPITVTIGVEWNVTSVGRPLPVPDFYTTQVTNGTLLVDVINKVADENIDGPFDKYASTYHAGLGYAITAINGTEQVWTWNSYLRVTVLYLLLPCKVYLFIPSRSRVISSHLISSCVVLSYLWWS